MSLTSLSFFAQYIFDLTESCPLVNEVSCREAVPPPSTSNCLNFRSDMNVFPSIEQYMQVIDDIGMAPYEEVERVDSTNLGS